MAKVEIIGSDTHTAFETAGRLTSALSESYDKAADLLKKVENSDWSGEAYESFIAYLTIVKEYHYDLYKTSKKQKSALKTVLKGADKYESNPSVAQVKSL